MSVTQTLTDLADLMTTVNPTPSNNPVLIQVPGHETVNLETFPAIIGYWDWRQEHSVDFRGDQSSRHKYGLLFYVLVGAKTTPIEELQTRLAPWPAALGSALFAHVQLNGDIEYMGNGEGPLITYQIGFWPLGANIGGRPTEYFGMRFTLAINETKAEVINS